MTGGIRPYAPRQVGHRNGEAQRRGQPHEPARRWAPPRAIALTPPQGWRSWGQIGVFKGRAPTENADTQAINMVYILCAVQ